MSIRVNFVVALESPCRLFSTLWTVDRQAPLSTGFPSKEYWNGFPFPSPGDILDPGIELVSPAPLTGPALQGVCEPPKAGAPPRTAALSLCHNDTFTPLVTICDFEQMPELWVVGMLGTVGSLSWVPTGLVPACAVLGALEKRKAIGIHLGVLMVGLERRGGWGGSSDRTTGRAGTKSLTGTYPPSTHSSTAGPSAGGGADSHPSVV